MVDEYNSNPKDELEERFTKLEAQVFDISYNMVILMSSLERKFRPFGELGNSNSMLALMGNLKIKKN
jgi:hypothetical protein